jgi:hypothetical protein
MTDPGLYSIGLRASFYVGLVGAAIMLLLEVVDVIFATDNRERLKAGLKGVFVSLGLGLSTALLVYPILNLALEDRYSVAQLTALELDSGIIGLRVATIALAGSAVLYVFGPEVALFNTKLETAVKRLGIDRASHKDRPFQVSLSAQFSIYLAAVSCLWLFAMLGISDLWVRIVTWALFFVADDWLLLRHYESRLFREYGERRWEHIPLLHRARLALFNVGFTAYLPYVLFRDVIWWSGVVMAAFLVVCLYLRYRGSTIVPKVDTGL